MPQLDSKSMDTVIFSNQIEQSEKILDVTLRPSKIDDEIEKLQSLLLPIDYEAAEKEIFNEYSTVDKNGLCIECTCTFREIVSYNNQKLTPSHSQENGYETLNLNSNGDKKKPVDSDEETDDFCAVDYEEGKTSPSMSMRSAVKSIFDPEYDANENLIEEIVLRKPPQRSEPKVIEIKVKKDSLKSSPPVVSNSESIAQKEEENFPIVNYEFEEDPLCPARAHFQRDSITERNVEILHNTFINGINGFWNGIIEENCDQDFTKDKEEIDYLMHGLWKRVVPRSDFLTMDEIPKTFDIEKSSSLPPLPLKNEKQLNEQEVLCKKSCDVYFKEWHEVMNVRSYNDEILTILPYVVID
jgi:hypothetical protein